MTVLGHIRPHRNNLHISPEEIFVHVGNVQQSRHRCHHIEHVPINLPFLCTNLKYEELKVLSTVKICIRQTPDLKIVRFFSFLVDYCEPPGFCSLKSSFYRETARLQVHDFKDVMS